VLQGLLDLYAATLNAAWLGEAVRMQGKQDELFLDTERGGYFTSKQGDEFVIIRLKEDQVIHLYLFFLLSTSVRILGSPATDPDPFINKEKNSEKSGFLQFWDFLINLLSLRIDANVP
jgi:hypothetical protein